MRGVWLGVDVGTVRVGVARSDPSGILASPLVTLTRDPRDDQDIAQLAELVREHEAVGVVVGLPRTLKGRDGPSAVMAREYAERLAQLIDVPVRHVDERLTTVSAQRKLRDGGLRGARATRAVIDQAAAVELLQHWLEIQRAQAGPENDVRLDDRPDSGTHPTDVRGDGPRTEFPGVARREHESLTDFDAHDALFDEDDAPDGSTTTETPYRPTRADRKRWERENGHARRSRRGWMIILFTLVVIAAVALLVVPRVRDYFTTKDYSGNGSGHPVVSVTVNAGDTASDIAQHPGRRGRRRERDRVHRRRGRRPGLDQHPARASTTCTQQQSGKTALAELLDPSSTQQVPRRRRHRGRQPVHRRGPTGQGARRRPARRGPRGDGQARDAEPAAGVRHADDVRGLPVPGDLHGRPGRLAAGRADRDGVAVHPGRPRQRVRRRTRTRSASSRTRR